MKKTYHKENLKKLNKAAIEIIVNEDEKTYHKENLKEEIIKATIEIIVNEEVESVLMRALATLVIFFYSAIVTVTTIRNFRILQFTNFSFKHLINAYSSFKIFLVHRL